MDEGTKPLQPIGTGLVFEQTVFERYYNQNLVDWGFNGHSFNQGEKTMLYKEEV